MTDKTPLQMVRQFHDAYGARIDEKPSRALFVERWELIAEELVELMSEWFDWPNTRREYVHATMRELMGVMLLDWPVDPDVALTSGRAERIAKELADLVYVLYGAAANLGINLDIAVRAVHNSNMTKTPQPGSNKPLKGDYYMAPYVREALPPWPRGED